MKNHYPPFIFTDLDTQCGRLRACSLILGEKNYTSAFIRTVEEDFKLALKSAMEETLKTAVIQIKAYPYLDSNRFDKERRYATRRLGFWALFYAKKVSVWNRVKFFLSCIF